MTALPLYRAEESQRLRNQGEVNVGSPKDFRYNRLILPIKGGGTKQALDLGSWFRLRGV